MDKVDSSFQIVIDLKSDDSPQNKTDNKLKQELQFIQQDELLKRTFSIKSPPKKRKIIVESRIVFLKIGQIDTRNERYDAEIYLECFWNDDELYEYALGLLKPEKRDKIESLEAILTTITYNREFHWSPQLYIENAIGETKEETLHNLELFEKENNEFTVKVREARKIRGIFYEVITKNCLKSHSF
jgi:hypothetical protein